jgi:hypothetical protein
MGSVGILIVIIFIAIITTVVRFFIRKVKNSVIDAAVGKIEDPLMKSTLANRSVQNEIARGNMMGALINAAITGTKKSITSSIDTSVRNGLSETARTIADTNTTPSTTDPNNTSK